MELVAWVGWFQLVLGRGMRVEAAEGKGKDRKNGKTDEERPQRKHTD